MWIARSFYLISNKEVFVVTYICKFGILKGFISLGDRSITKFRKNGKHRTADVVSKKFSQRNVFFERQFTVSFRHLVVILSCSLCLFRWNLIENNNFHLFHLYYCRGSFFPSELFDEENENDKDSSDLYVRDGDTVVSLSKNDPKSGILSLSS